MTTTTLSLTSPEAIPPELLDPRLAKLKQMVLDSVVSPHSKRNYGRALDDLFLFAASQPLTRSLLMEWRAALEKLSLLQPSMSGFQPSGNWFPRRTKME